MESIFFIVPGNSTENKVDLFNTNRELVNLSFNGDINVDESNNVINMSAKTISYSDLSTSFTMSDEQITDIHLSQFFTVSRLTTTKDPVTVDLPTGTITSITNNGHSASFNTSISQLKLMLSNAIRDQFFDVSDNIKYNFNDGVLLSNISSDSGQGQIYDYSKIKSLSAKNIRDSTIYFISSNNALLASVNNFQDNVTFEQDPDKDKIIITGGYYNSYSIGSDTYNINISTFSTTSYSFLYSYVLNTNILTLGEGIRSYPSVIELPTSNFDILYDSSELLTYVDIIFNVKYSITESLNMNVKIDNTTKLAKTIIYTANQIIAFMIRLIRNSKGEINCYMLN